jgi:hypothetical protein
MKSLKAERHQWTYGTTQRNREIGKYAGRLKMFLKFKVDERIVAL